MPNLHKVSFCSALLNKTVRLRVSARGLRTIEHSMGVDGYLLNTPAQKLTKQLRDLKKKVIAASLSSDSLHGSVCDGNRCSGCDGCGVDGGDYCC